MSDNLACLNVERLQAIREVILREPEHFDMDVWDSERWGGCGTVRCIGGWAEHFFGPWRRSMISAGIGSEIIEDSLQCLFFEYPGVYSDTDPATDLNSPWVFLPGNPTAEEAAIAIDRVVFRFAQADWYEVGRHILHIESEEL